VRAAAITSLQSTLLAHDLGQLSAVEWSQCLEQVLFPLLAQLMGPIAANDPLAVEETRVRAAMLLSKVSRDRQRVLVPHAVLLSAILAPLRNTLFYYTRISVLSLLACIATWME
jgi:hypothetical protein